MHLTCDTVSYSCWFTTGSDPIFDGTRILQRFCDLHSETCTITHGGLLGLVFGGLHPVFLAIPCEWWPNQV